jgi:hypothetical protein
MARFRDRPTSDILVILIASTICAGLILTATVSWVFAFVYPDTADLAGPARYIADITNTLIGLLAGFLAGTTTTYAVVKGSAKGHSGDEDEGHEQEGQDDPGGDNSQQQ